LSWVLSIPNLTVGKKRNFILKTFNFGLVHSLVTPFKDGKIDYDTLGHLIEFHIQQQADGLAIPSHTGESVSITGIERKEIFKFAVKTANGRVPIIANVSEAGTDLACDLARSAMAAGASALYACVPYYWTPPESMLLEHFTKIGQAGQLPFFVYNSPEEMSGVKVSSKLTLNLIKDLPEFAGIIDLSLDWQYMIEVISEAKRMQPNFQLISGTEYMISARAIGATGLLSSVSNVAPQMIRHLYDLCLKENYQVAYELQVDAAFLYRLFNQYGISGLKAISQSLGRDVGNPRMPLDQLQADQIETLKQEWRSCLSIKNEPHAWST
jgi:4-hydroxy-tetrahydrodipicolinate synthase